MAVQCIHNVQYVPKHWASDTYVYVRDYVIIGYRCVICKQSLTTGITWPEIIKEIVN